MIYVQRCRRIRNYPVNKLNFKNSTIEKICLRNFVKNFDRDS